MIYDKQAEYQKLALKEMPENPFAGYISQYNNHSCFCKHFRITPHDHDVLRKRPPANCVRFAAMTSMYTRRFLVILLSIYLIIIETGGNRQWCNDSPYEIRHATQCWAPDFALDMRGMIRHHCILTCMMRKDCRFLNYQFKEGRCQFASVCVALRSLAGIEAMLFGKAEQSNKCANWIPATEFGNSRRPRHTPCVARLITDKYILLGSMLYPNFKGAYYNGSGAPMVIETMDINSTDFLEAAPGCRMSWHGPGNYPNFWGLAIPGGFLYMDDAVLATLYVAMVDGKIGYYNSVTKKVYHVNDDIVNVTSGIYLRLARYVWRSMRYPMTRMGPVRYKKWRFWQKQQWYTKLVFHICESWQ